MADSRRVTTMIVIGVACVACVGVIVLQQTASDPPEGSNATEHSVNLPQLQSSRYLNTGLDAKLIGTNKCAKCHAQQFESYSQTRHSAAMALVQPATEPASQEFHHQATGRHYSVYRNDNGLYHRESIITDNAEEVVLSDHPVKYVIGSGNLAKTYVVEMDGFLCESPITWYETEQRWDLSPGFNTEFHDGFQRPVNSHCVNCHAGDASPVDGSAHKIAFSEFGISCERCHGPGSIHATARSAESHVGDAGDLTIVNPRRLDRELSEAVCATCHLDTVATSDVRGRHRNDFRPGQRLGDFRVDYRLKSGSDSMSVVGHVEQMRMSRCYTESEVLTCISCHNPHYEPPLERRFEYFRQKCLDCHNVDACGVNATVRQKTKPADNCVSCHMPTSDTEVPHVASTHHRIGIHAPSRSDSQDFDEVPGELVAISDVSHLSAADQNRCLGLAYLEFSYKHEDDNLANTYRQRAHSLLMDAYERGLRDGELLVGLSRVHRFIDLTAAIRFAKAALAANDLSADSRANALSTLGLSLFDQGKHGEAAVALERFVEIQRHAGGWFVLGMCRQSLGDWSGAQRAAEMASRIGTDVPAFYEFAATLAEQNGQQAEARRLMYRARLLSQ